MPTEPNPEAAQRKFIFPMAESNAKEFTSNYISTTKYTAFNFLFKCLMLQFTRYANIYFLVVAILQSIPFLSPLNPISSIAPLILVISLSMIREAFEDLARYKSDLETNSYKTTRYVGREWEEVEWKELIVGDIVRIEDMEYIPADIVVLTSVTNSKKPELNSGQCYIMTSSLDGEKNLKPRLSLKVTQNMYANKTDLIIGGKVVCGQPNDDLKRLKGYLTIDNINSNLTMDGKNLLLRGSQLKNTEYIKMVKVTQAMFINQDEDMKNFEDGRFSKAFNSTLNEELGQIEYIFSDKTGTLTSNNMEFRFFLVGNELFGAREGEGSLQGNDASETDLEEDFDLKRMPTHIDKKNQVVFSFEDERVTQYVRRQRPGPNINLQFIGDNNKTLYECVNMQHLMQEFMLSLSLCHDCILEPDKESPENFNYQGPSPDEITLVDAARHLGYVFRRNTSDGKIVEIDGREHKIEQLEFFEFSSARKRATIIVRHDKVIKMYMKGADSIVISRLDNTRQQPFMSRYGEKLQKYSEIGLRTLLFAMKVISEDDYQKIEQTLEELTTRNASEKEKQEYIDSVETGFTAIGMTAVEDKLQERVPECIANFIEANIKVWMLTGDKLETAENIAYSCSLIQADFQKYYIRLGDDYAKSAKELRSIITECEKKGEAISVIIEGAVLSKIVDKEEIIKELVVHGLSRADSVVICRMSPKQKGFVVRVVKKYINKITLGIGDGANDVNMIQEADIGIGLYGKEGLRAVQSSDYALVEFQCLWKLLFVHGRWSYIRISEMIMYFYYKNIVFALPQFFFLFWNGYSGQTFFEDFYISFFNLLFTSWPVIIRAVFDQDINYKKWSRASKNPVPNQPQNGKIIRERLNLKEKFHYLYYVGQKNLIFNYKNILLWFLNSVVASLVVFYVCSFAFGDSVINSEGHSLDIWFLSILVYTVVIFVVDLKLMMFTRHFNVFIFISVFLFSIVLYVVYFLIADSIPVFLIYKTGAAVLSSGRFYLTLLLIFGFLLLVDLFFLALHREWSSPLYMLFKSLVQKKKGSSEEKRYFKHLVRKYTKQIDREF